MKESKLLIFNNYCVKRIMFFSIINPIIKNNLTENDANELCKRLNKEELDDTYVNYKVFNC